MKVSTPDSSLEHPSSWRGEHIPLLLPSELFAPCPFHKPWLETLRVSLPGRRTPGRAQRVSEAPLFPTFTEQQQPRLSPAPSTSPGVRVGAGVPRPRSVKEGGENGGRANRKGSLAVCRIARARNRAAAGISRPFLPGGCEAAPSLPARPGPSAGSARWALRKPPRP